MNRQVTAAADIRPGLTPQPVNEWNRGRTTRVACLLQRALPAAASALRLAVYMHSLDQQVHTANAYKASLRYQGNRSKGLSYVCLTVSRGFDYTI